MKTLDRDRFYCTGNPIWQNQRPATSYYEDYKKLENGALDNWHSGLANSIIDCIDAYTSETISTIANDVRQCLELLGVICHLNREWETLYGKSNIMARNYNKLHSFIHLFIRKYREAKINDSQFFPPTLKRY